MKRNTLVLGFIFILLGGLLPRGAHAQAGPPEFVEIFGHKASATSLLARLKDPGNVAMIKQADQILAQQGFQKQAGFNVKLVKGLVRIELAAGAAANAMNADDLANHIRQLKASGAFHYVEPDWIVTVSQAPPLPTDTGFTDGTLWGLRNTGQNGGTAGVDVNAVPAWGITTGSPTVIVGVVDTGIRYTHQDLAANMWRNPGEIAGNGVDDDGNGYVDDVFGINGITNTGNPMDDNNHGSHCAGTIAATANNAGLHVGVAYNARLMGLKFLSASGSGATGDAIKCIDYGVAKGAHILSNSWGGGGFSQALADSIAAANAAGVLFVAAAGNSSANNDTTPNYPSNYDSANVVAVAAVDRTGALASFSSYGATTVDLGAPGVDITSSTATSDTSYASFNGTSMATPHVSGVAALLKSRYPSAGVVELKNRLLASTRPLASLAGRTVSGGIVDAHGALTVAADGVIELRASAAVSPLSSGVTTAFFVTVTDLTPVLGATVTGALGTAPAVPFLDSGVAPDVTANDGVYSANLPVPSTGTSVTLNVTASAGGAPVTGAFPFAIVNPPANDNIANRILLAAGTTQTTGTNRLSSRETGEPINPSVAGGRTVWWEWVAGTTGSVTITTSGSSYDTTLAIYSGSGTLGSLVLLGANDDSIGLASSVTFTATNGQRYYVQVDGYGGGTGDITLNYPSPLAVNSPPSIVTQPVGAILVEGEPLSLSVTANGTLPLSYQWALNGAPIGGATSATYSVAAVAEAHEGNYRVTITNSFGTITSATVFVGVDPISVRPPNDAFAAAEVLPGATGRVNGTNQRASGETGEPNHAGASTPLESVWYRWTAPANGTLAVDTYGSSLDTTLAVYTGSAVNALTLRGSNNDSGGLQSFVSVPVTAGQVLSIAVDGVGTLESIFSLNYHFQSAVVGVQNDAFANRTIVPGAPGTITGTNIGATGEVGEPVHSPLASPPASVWWAWTAPASGVAVIDTLGSDFDTVLAVYTGSSVAALTPVASNDDAGGPQSRLTFPCVAGTSYAIAVDGRGTAEGNIALRIVSGASEPEVVVEEPVGTGLVDGTSTVNFGSVVTTGSASRVFTVRNTGGAALTSLALSVTGANAADFAITTQPSAPLAGGGVTTFTVRFAPGAPGARSAALRIASNDADENPFDIALTGTGIVAAPEIAVEQPSGTNLTDGVSTVSFGYSAVSGTASRTFTVRNTGNATLSGVAVTFGGTNAADFTVTTPPTATVAAGANTTFTVRFSPGGTGARTATLAISSNDADENPFDLTLNGNGTAEPPIVRTINTTDRGWYGSTGSHTPSNDNYFTGYGLANSPPELRSFFVFAIPVMAPEETLVSAELQLFNPSNGFSSADPTETLEIREVTTPTASLIAGTGGVAAFTDLGDGLLYGPLAVSSANNGGTVTIPLGNGFAAAVLARSGSDIALGGSLSTITRTRDEFVFAFTGGTGTPTQLVLTSIVTYTDAEIAVEQPVGTSLTDGVSTVNFGITALGTPRDLTFTIRNPGIANLTGLGITIDGANPGDFTVITPPTAPVAPGGSTTFTVRFNPSAASVRTAALHIASNDPNEGSFDIALTGRGYTAPVGLDFQIVSMGSTGAAVVDHDAITSDDRGGIAVSTDRVFVTGDSATSRHALANLSGGASIGRVSNGLCSDIGTGIVYVLANNGVETPGGGTINQLIELDPLTGALTGNIIPLSSSITLSSDSGVFSGNGRVVLHNGTNVFDILVPSGVVTDLGAMTRPAWYRSESWAIWGVAEFFGGELHLAYRPASGSTIVRSRVPDGAMQTIATFTNLGDMASWTVSPQAGRWYFHHEGSSQFGGSSETLGYADATFAMGPPTAPPVITSPLTTAAFVNVPFQYSIRATNSPTSYGATGLPTGLTVNTTTGVISGSVGTAGTYPITISATNIIGPTTATLTLTVTLARPASLFANSTYVDTSAGGEMENTRTALTGLGYIVTTFTGIADTDWNAAFAADVVIIPELERGTPLLTPAAIAAINARLSSGKGLVVMGAAGSNEQTFLNSLRGWTLADSGSLSSGTIAKVSGVPGFVNSPASLNALNATYLVSTASLPAGSVPVYQTGTSTAVFANGQIAYLGYDWFAGQDAGWSAVLGDAIMAVAIPPGPPTAPPVITSPLTAAAFVNVPFQYTIRATGSPTSYGATGLPTGLTVNTTTGVISGSVGTAGTYPITISATNIIGPTTATLTLTVRTGFFDDFDPGIDAPLWSAFGGTVTANTIGQAAGPGSTGNSLHFAGTGSRFATTAPFDTRGAIEVRFLIALGNGSAPGWENVDSGEEVVLEYSNDGTTFVQIGGPYSHRTWTQVTIPVPAGARTAATRFRWRQLANSGEGFDNWAIEDAMISVVNPPVITSADTATGTIGVAFNYQITATNSPASFGAAGLPAGLSVNTSTGLISGTPTATGTSTVNLSATNAGGTGTATLSLTVRSTIESWRLFYFGNATGFIGNLQDFDHDGVLNLFEFAFGTDPTVRGGGPLQYNGTFAGGGTIGATGQPITVFEPTALGIDYRALFVRRVDHVAAGLTYTPQFSADLQTWVPSVVVPTVLANDGTNQIVSVPYPPFVGGKKARFFRISVSIAP